MNWSWLPRGDATALALRKTGVRTGLALLLIILNPFGSRTWLEARSYEYWQLLNAPYYGPTLASHQPVARDQIVVVMIDGASRDMVAGRRDLDALDVSQMIEDIIAAPGGGAAPKAVFVDLLLGSAAPRGESVGALVHWSPAAAEACAKADRAKIKENTSFFQCLLIKVAEITAYNQWKTDPRCQLNNLEKVLCIRNKGGIPVLFADPTPPPEGDVPASTEAGLRALGWVGGLTPVVIPSGAYPLIRRSGAKKASFTLYPAAALYAAGCEGAPCAPVRGPAGTAIWPQDFERNVEVAWGADVPGGPERPFARMLRRLEGPAAACPRQVGLIQQFLGLALPGFWTFTHSACTYTDFLPYRLLQSDIRQEELRQALGGKVVLLGAHLQGDNDMIAAPPYGALPGVFLHAMALDNLMQRGADYPKPPAPLPGNLLTSRNLVELAAFFAITFVVTLLTIDISARNEKGSPLRARGWAKRAGLVLSFALVVFGLVPLLLAMRGLAPDNFDIAVAWIAGLVGLGELFAEAFKPAWTRLLIGPRSNETETSPTGGT